MRWSTAGTMLALATTVTACDVKQQPATGTSTETAAASAGSTPTGGVTREQVEREAPVQRMAEQTAMQSQPGPDGAQLDLMKVAVTGDILTVALRCSSEEKFNTEMFALKDISVIDDASAQRIGVLKDNEGNWLASRTGGDFINADCAVKPGVIWAKFPAPPATSKTVSINLPGVAPFDGVPVTR